VKLSLKQKRTIWFSANSKGSFSHGSILVCLFLPSPYHWITKLFSMWFPRFKGSEQPGRFRVHRSKVLGSRRQNSSPFNEGAEIESKVPIS